MKKKKAFGVAMRLLAVVAGNLIFAFGITAFSIPNNFLVGGTTGIGRIMTHYFALPVTATIAAINVVMFVLGFIFLGKEFAFTTLVSTVIFPVFLDFFLSLPGLSALTSDLLLAALLSGAVNGLGLGLVLRMGGSTGGMDIPPIILYRKFRFPIAAGMYIFDLAILGGQILFSGSEQVLYGIVSVLITTMVLNKVLVTGSGNAQVTIISSRWAEINHMIQIELDRGSTYIPVETGYQNRAQKAVMCVLPSREVGRLNAQVLQIDSHAFIVINSTRDVKGRGFTLSR